MCIIVLTIILPGILLFLSSVCNVQPVPVMARLLLQTVHCLWQYSSCLNILSTRWVTVNVYPFLSTAMLSIIMSLHGMIFAQFLFDIHFIMLHAVFCLICYVFISTFTFAFLMKWMMISIILNIWLHNSSWNIVIFLYDQSIINLIIFLLIIFLSFLSFFQRLFFDDVILAEWTV